jgi:TolB-like protein
MAEFFAELKRRHIYRVGAAYVVVAWALAQGIDLLSQVFELPGWIARPAVVVLAIGFPIALVTAWMIESKPHEAVASAVRSKPTIVDWTLCGALAAVLLFMGYQQLAPSSDATTTRPGVDAAKEAAASAADAISLAVLPFANLSGDPSQEFFSDGITEEVTSALARVPDLRVVARTSAYQFRDQNRDIQSIGQQLHATHFIEGSVRRAGDRVRITAQLIKADDATHVWAETFDRELTDIFAIQEDIATAIAGALRMPLGLKAGETLVSLRPKDEQTYELFLRGRTAFRTRRIPEALGLLEQVVARDPNFAAGWRFLALTRDFDAIQRRVRSEEPRVYSESNETLARRTITLAPNYAGGYALLAQLVMHEGKWLEAMDFNKQALALDPDDPEVLGSNWNQLWTLGYLKDALDVAERVHLLEPLVPNWNFLRAETLAAAGMVGIGLRDWLPVRRSDGE